MKKTIAILLMYILLFSGCENQSTNRSSSVGGTISITPSHPEISSIISKVESNEKSVSNQENIVELKRRRNHDSSII